MKVLIIDMNSRSLGTYEFVQPIINVIGKLTKYKVCNYLQLKAEQIRKYDAIIFSGVPLKDDAYLSHLDKFDWLPNCSVPILGICAGAQIIGLAFGAKLKRCKEIGLVELVTQARNPLFSGHFKAYCLHKYALKLSSTLRPLASSKKCIEAFKHKRKPIYGLLFHPEVRNKEILERFLKIV